MSSALREARQRADTLERQNRELGEQARRIAEEVERRSVVGVRAGPYIPDLQRLDDILIYQGAGLFRRLPSRPYGAGYPYYSGPDSLFRQH